VTTSTTGERLWGVIDGRSEADVAPRSRQKLSWQRVTLCDILKLFSLRKIFTDQSVRSGLVFECLAWTTITASHSKWRTIQGHCGLI